MDYKALLNELLAALNVSKKKFAEELKLSQGNVSDWFNKPNARPSIDALRKIADRYNVNINWLVTGKGPMFIKVPARARHLKAADFQSVPVVGEIAAGAGLEVWDVEPSEQIQIHCSLLSEPGPYIAFKVAGESMAPYISTGDYAIVTTSWHHLDVNSRILAIRTLNGLTLKRYYIHDSREFALLIPINPDYPIIEYTQDSPDYTIVGLLALIIRKYL